MSTKSQRLAAGGTGFAGFMMIMLACWWLIAGIVAVFGNGEFFVASADWTFKMSVQTWGWIHLLLGVFMLAAGFGVFNGAPWARTVGVTLATVAGVAAFAWMPYFPVWAIMLIVGSVVVIWALGVYDPAEA